MSEAYGVNDVEKLLKLPKRTIRALVAAGFVTPARGARGAWQFSFQDLIVLRTAQALADANIPARRITRSMRELRRRLPAEMPLSGLRVDALGGDVVVREGNRQWQPATGQYLLTFDGDPAQGALSASVIEPAPAASTRSDDSRAWFERGEALEGGNPEAAIDAYTEALRADAALVDARINLGRLLHEAGRHAQAEAIYREAADQGDRDPLLWFNLGVLYDDMARPDAAVAAYECALASDGSLADAHYNLALLHERQGRRRDALRHMARYRALTAARR